MASNRSYSFSHSRQGMTMQLESDTEVMGRDADLYVRKIELEVKKLHNLKRAVALMKKDREDRRANCTVLKRNLDASVHKINNVKNASLVKQKTHYLKKHDEIQEKVTLLQSQIDTLRKARLRHITQINSGWGLVDEKKEKLSQMTTLLEKRRDIVLQQQDQMYELNQRNHDEKLNYTNKFDQIQMMTDEEKRQQDFARKHQVVDIEGDELASTFDTSNILKKRLQKMILKNKEKVKIMDTYMRFMSIIDNTFNQIKETTGITDIKEIQNTFIKSEEQNHSLLTYVDLLHQQIDQLEDQNVEVEKKIEISIQENQQKRNQLAQTPSEVTQVKNLEKIIAAKEKKVADFSELLQQIKPSMEKTLKQMAQSCINRDRSKAFEYEQSSINLNDKTVSNYCADLEEFSNSILLFESQKAKFGQTNLLLTKDVPMKDFAPRIQKPVSINRHHMDSLGVEEKKYISREEFDKFASDHIERKLKNNMGANTNRNRQQQQAEEAQAM